MPYAWSMRTIPAASALAAALALASATAGAQSKPPQQTLILQKQQLGTAAFASVARARMRSGDCAGALDAFDEAIAHSIDASLYRDRGLCHEQLGQPYPAIDDYRTYLTAEPDAADAEGIRGRLGRLEQTTLGKSSRADDDDTPDGMSKGGAGASASVSVGGAGDAANADATAQLGPGGKPRDPMDYVEHDNDMMKSPLRRGRGFSFAPIFAVHKWFFDGTSFGDSYTWAESVGLQFRYSFGRVASVFVEGGYQRFNSTSSSANSPVGDVQGLTSQLGLELRFPLDVEYDNELLVSPGIGFDNLTQSSNLAGGPSITVGAIIPRVRAGVRHLLDQSAAIDFTLDFGLGKFAQYNGDFPFGGDGSEVAMLGLDVALVWGL